MIFFERLITLLKYLPSIIWASIVGIFEWFVPKSWCAKDVSNEIVLITGAGSGLGRSIALEFAKLGSSLVLWDINDLGLQETRQLVELEHLNYTTKQAAKNPGLTAVKRFCLTSNVDVSDRLQVQKNAQRTYNELNRDSAAGEDERFVSVLVNNAGIYHGLLLQDLKDEQIERIFKINILSHFWTVRAFLPNMMKHGRGHIVEIASMGGIGGLVKQVDYCATKFATVGFEESLSIELDYLNMGHKIFTTVICPFFFKSNLFIGYDSNAAPIMSSTYVAKQTVWAMRCNYSRCLLPPLSAYLMFIFRSFTPRRATILWTKALGWEDSVKDIRGAAVDA